MKEMTIELGKQYTGWYFPLGKKEIFVVSGQKKKTQNFLSKILQSMLLPDNPDTRKELAYYIRPATLEMKFLAGCHTGPLQWDDRCYYNIFGKGFSGYGSEDVTDGKTIIIEL